MTKPTPLNPPLDYKSAGVDIDAGAQLVNEIKPIVAKTRTAGVMAGLGGFGAGFDIKAAGFKGPHPYRRDRWCWHKTVNRKGNRKV